MDKLPHPQANTLDLRQRTQPSTPPQTSRKFWPPKASRQLAPILIILTVGIALIFGSIALKNELTRRKAISHIPDDIRQEVEFPLYVPQNLPIGYSLDDDSFSSKHGVVTFTINYNTDKKLAFTEQAKPAGDIKGLYTMYFRFAQPIKTPYGQLYTGRSVSGAASASLVTDHTWILAATEKGIDSSALEQIMRQLTKSN